LQFIVDQVCSCSLDNNLFIAKISVTSVAYQWVPFLLQKVLAAHGASKVSAYVTHGVFPKKSWERFTNTSNGKHTTFFAHSRQQVLTTFVCQSVGLENPFTYFWITDSCPLTVKAIANRAPFEVLSLAGSIADALQI